jgi:hypothetical protein
LPNERGFCAAKKKLKKDGKFYLLENINIFSVVWAENMNKKCRKLMNSK